MLIYVIEAFLIQSFLDVEAGRTGSAIEAVRMLSIRQRIWSYRSRATRAYNVQH